MYSDVSLFALFSRQFSVSHNIVDTSVLTRIGLAAPYPSGSAHLFCTNAGVAVCVELHSVDLYSKTLWMATFHEQPQ
jgi:hypothetical protein